MKSLVLIISIANILFATTLKVKRADIVITINKVEVFLEKDETMKLFPKEKICVVKGKGQIIINNEIKISIRSRNKCYINEKKLVSKDILGKANEYLDSTEDNIGGMSRKLVLKKNNY